MNNTGNALGSTDVRDLLDNAHNLDLAVNDLANNTWVDRFGVTRKTLKGYDFEFETDQAARALAFETDQAARAAEFQEFLDGTGWVSLGAYGAGISIVSHTQTVDYLGQPYSLKPSVPASLESPYVTTGVWATEGVNFKLVGDNSLRQDLATSGDASKGAGQVGNSVIVVATVAEMVAMVNLYVGQRIKTLGYYSAGDGGSNEYLVVPPGTGTVDGGMYIGLIGVQAKGLFPERSVLTKQFGIQGDGTLITPASTMQKVIDTSLSDDATGAWGPDTMVNPGTVVLDGTISVAGGRRVSGKGGQNTTKLVAKGGSFDVSKDSIIDLVGAFTLLNNLGVRVDVDLYDPVANTGTPVDCVSVESANAFGNTIRDFRANGGATGIRVRMGFETKIFGSFIVGSRIGIDITAWDTEINNTIIQDTPNYGVQTTRGLESAMLHVVRAGVAAVYIRDSGNPVNMVNTFIDTPFIYGFRLAAQRGAMITNTYILKIGGETGDPTATGVSLSSASTGNAFIGGNVVNTHSNFLGVFNFDNTSINNVIAFWRISSKTVSAAAAANMRKQTVVGCMEDAARYNNVPRKNRVVTTGVAVGATADIVLTLDYTYPVLTFNTLLFYGKWVSRNSSSQGAFGDMALPVQFGDSGCAPVVTKISGHANNAWAVTAVVLSGNLLTVTVQNNGTSTASISIEIERSMDATGVTF